MFCTNLYTKSVFHEVLIYCRASVNRSSTLFLEVTLTIIFDQHFLFSIHRPSSRLTKQNNFSTMADMMFALGQTKTKKEREDVTRKTKAETWKYKGNPGEDAETQIRKEQFERDQTWKSTKTDTKKKLKDVNMAVASFETEIRKEQHQREQAAKEKARMQIKQNTNFDMARSLFGGGEGQEKHMEAEE
jgi:molecular chaperone DnaK (HSP70)